MFRRILQTLKYSIFPSKCLGCGIFFHPDPDPPTGTSLFDRLRHDLSDTIFYRVMNPFLCRDCRKDYYPVHPPYCTRCGKMFESRSGSNHHCGQCITDNPPCLKIRAAGIYSGALKSNIHALKYKNKVHLARPLGRLLFSSFMNYYNSCAIECIIPVPLHGSRLRQRGFNQAAMMIREWPALFNSEDAGRVIDIDCKNLVRKRKTVSQTGLGREKRIQNVKGAFALTDPSKISGKHVLLVDDVYTTGSTCDACAGTLLANGAESVSVLTLARAE